jgi:excisionase family DNA binding protein
MPASPTPNDTLIDINAVAARLGVQVRHVRRLVHERRIPIKWGHLIRFERTDIDARIDRARRPMSAACGVDPCVGVPAVSYGAPRPMGGGTRGAPVGRPTRPLGPRTTTGR